MIIFLLMLIDREAQMQNIKIVYFQIHKRVDASGISGLYNTMCVVGSLWILTHKYCYPYSPCKYYLVYSEFKTNTHTLKNSILWPLNTNFFHLVLTVWKGFHKLWLYNADTGIKIKTRFSNDCDFRLYLLMSTCLCFLYTKFTLSTIFNCTIQWH